MPLDPERLVLAREHTDLGGGRLAGGMVPVLDGEVWLTPARKPAHRRWGPRLSKNTGWSPSAETTELSVILDRG